MYMLFSLTFYSYYVRWIEASGARVVAIPWDVTPDRLQWYASRVNAVLFPGGGLEDGATMSAYFNNVILWHDTSIEFSKQGRRLVSREAGPAATRRRLTSSTGPLGYLSRISSALCSSCA